MKLSERIPNVQKNNPLAAELARRDSSSPLIDLTVSNPTVAGVAPQLAPLMADLAPELLETYAPSPLGRKKARVALASALSEDKNIDINPNDLVLLSSTSEAYGLLFKVLGSPGDSVWAPSPSYPLFDQIARLESLILRKYNLIFSSGDWYVDQSLENLKSPPGSKSCALLAVHPNNPTGTYLSNPEARYLEELSEEADIPLIVDEVFYEYDLAKPIDSAPSFLKPTPPPTLTLGGMSKAFCLPHVKLAWIHLGGPEIFRNEIRRALEYASDAYLSLSNAAQALLPMLLPARKDIQNRVLERLKKNLAYLQSSTRESPISPLPVYGGWYAIIALPHAHTDQEWATRILRDKYVLTHPGFLYDIPQEGMLVLSLLTPPEQFREGVDRIIHFVQRDL